MKKTTQKVLAPILAIIGMTTILSACQEENSKPMTDEATVSQAQVQETASTLVSEEFSGVIEGYDFFEHKFQAKQGAKLKVKLDNPKLEAIIFASEPYYFNNDEAYVVPKTGEYSLRVLMPRAFARRGDKHEFKLKLEMSQP